MLKKFTLNHKQRLNEIFNATPQVDLFVNDTPEKQRNRIAQVTGDSWKSFVFFCNTYLSFIFKLGFCDDHKEMFKEVENGEYGITAVTGFRGFGKTVILAIAYVMWKIAKGEKYVIQVAANERLVKKRTLLLLRQFQKNKRLLHDFPQLRYKEGELSSFFLENDTLIEGLGIDQDCRGSFHPVTAERPGLIVNDDVDRKKNRGNAHVGKDRRESITQEQKGCLDSYKPTRIIWLGNLVYPTYAICQFEKEISDRIKSENDLAKPEDRKHLVYHKNKLLRFPLENRKGHSVWEEKYSTESLPELRIDFGYTGYLREMLGKAVIEGAQFKNEWFKVWSKLPAKFNRVWMYADPARGSKGCYKAIIAIGSTKHKYYCLKVWVRQTKQSSFYRYFHTVFTELRQRYGSRFRAAMEANFKQDDILEAMDRWCDDNELGRISHFVKKIYNTDDKDYRIEQLEVPIEVGKLEFPEGQDMETLKAQFLIFESGKKSDKDGPDATAGCMERFDNFGKKKGARIRTLG